MKTDNTPWARWARKTCTLLLWTLGLALVLSVGILGWVLVSDGASVHQFFAKSGRLALGGKPLDLSAISDAGQIRFLVVSFLVSIGLWATGVFLVLTRLRWLLDEVVSSRPFSFESISDLKLIGTVLLVASVAVTLCADLVEVTAGAVVPGYPSNLSLTPDLTLLLCGFLVRTLAVIFAHGVRLQRDADLTV